MQVATGAWTGTAFIQYDINEVRVISIDYDYTRTERSGRAEATRAVFATGNTMVGENWWTRWAMSSKDIGNTGSLRTAERERTKCC